MCEGTFLILEQICCLELELELEVEVSCVYRSLKVILFASILFSSFSRIGAMNWDCYFVLIMIRMRIDQSAAIVLH